jgi:hypothetical protein
LRLCAFASKRKKQEPRTENRETRAEKQEPRDEKQDVRVRLDFFASLRAIERLRHEVRFLPQAGTSYQSLQLILKKKKKKSA